MSCAKASELAASQLAAVESRLAHLGRLRSELRRMVKDCGNGRVTDCCIIDALKGP